jgi:hypothetical protein
MLNKEVFLYDPMTRSIPNNGVAKVGEPGDPQEWDVLRWELISFVCEGEYQRGLERLLATYLGNLDKSEQPAVWVSGFYGSGKSHFVRVLEYLWRDISFPDGATARGLTSLPSDIEDHLRELSTRGRQEGGLWSAAGMLSGAAGDNVRLALLGIVLRSAGLPDSYAPARLALWLKQNGHYDAIPGFASDRTEVRTMLREQYPPVPDISLTDMLETMHEVLLLQSERPGVVPCTLLIFDELQQFIAKDPVRTLRVQELVEECSSHFGSRVVFVATGQAALQATPQLSKLQGRFTVPVMLSDRDVEKVVRR